MLRRLKYLVSMVFVLCVAGCDNDLYELEICTYTLQLRYHYNEENTTVENKIVYWIRGIDEYIFDAQEILYMTRRVTESVCTENLDSEIDLPAGRYSVIGVGNRDTRSSTWDAATGRAPEIGKTHRDDMRLSLTDPDSFEDGTVGPCEELFHGYRTFTVGETGASRVRVDMINTHFQLRFRVTWTNASRTPSAGTYYAVLEDVPSQYALMPQYIYPAGEFSPLEHDPSEHDFYPYNDNDVIHHIPHTGHDSDNMLSHSNTTYLNADGEVWGQLVNYRIKTDMHPILKLYYSPGGTRAEGDPMVFPRAIDLQTYFRWFGYELDHELKQDYVLDIVIDGDRIILNPLDGLSIADWSEGGRL